MFFRTPATCRWLYFVFFCLILPASGDSPRPCLTLPRLQHKPSIDGIMSPGEWDRAVPLSGFWNWINDGPVSDTTVIRAGYDDDALYLAVHGTGDNAGGIVARAQGRDAGAWQDDALEIWLASPRNPKEYFQLVVSAGNQIYDASATRGTGWNPDWQHAATHDEHEWVAEVSIPWKSLGWAAPAEGESFWLDMAHNNPTPNERRKPEYSVWAIPREGKYKRLEAVSDYPTVRLGGTSVLTGVDLSFREGVDAPALRLVGINSAAESAVVTYRAGNSPRTSLAVLPHGVATVDLPVPLAEDGVGELPVSVWAADGTLVYHHIEKCKAQFSARFLLKKLFPLNYLEISLDAPGPAGSRLTWEALDAQGREVLASVTASEDVGKPLRVDLTNWREEEPYTFLAVLLGKAGQKIAARRFLVTRPSRPPWLGTPVGMSEEPLPPYTPIQVSGTRFSCLLKEYDFGSRSFPVGLRSEGHELLAAPVQMPITYDQHTVDLAGAPIHVTYHSGKRCEWRTEWYPDKLTVGLQGWIEEDGFMWFRVEVEPRETVTVDSLQLVIPVRREFAQFINADGPEDNDFHQVARRLDDRGWKARDAFLQVVNLLNYERGISVIAKSRQFWSNQNPKACESVVMTKNPVGGRSPDRPLTVHREVSARPALRPVGRKHGGVGRPSPDEETTNTALLKYDIIDRPTSLRGKRVFEFGIQAMPAKPADRNSRSRRTFHDIRYGEEIMSAGEEGPANLRYPLAGNLDPSRGTLEVYLYTDFDAAKLYPDDRFRWHLTRRLCQIGAGSDSAYLLWSAHHLKWQLVREVKGNPLPDIIASQMQPWSRPDWHHVALTWGDRLRLYSDGKLVAETEAQGLLPAAITSNPEAFIEFGKHHGSYRSEFRIAAIRVSSNPLTPGEMGLNGEFRKTPSTLLLQDFTRARPGGNLPPPEVGKAGKLHDAARLEKAHGRNTLTFGPIPDRSLVDYFADLGAKILIFHDQWTHFYGYPNTAYGSSLRYLVEACHRRGMKLLVYMGFGVALRAPESQLYDDFWTQYPVQAWEAQEENRYFNHWCYGTPYTTDFQLDGMAKLLSTYDVDGFYYDGTYVGLPCTNPHHGCGWVDDEGTLHPSQRILEARRFIKRLYAICKEHRPDTFIDCHGSGAVGAYMASWIDRHWIGEQFRANDPARLFSLEKFVAQCTGRPYGMPADFLVFEQMGLSFDQALSYTMLHDVEPRAIVWHRQEVKTIARIWELKDAFDTDRAEWHPYWKNGSYVTTFGGTSYASFYLHRNRRALVVLSNLQKDPAEVTLTLNLSKMGLRGKAKDALSDKSFHLDKGTLRKTLNGNAMCLVWVE